MIVQAEKNTQLISEADADFILDVVTRFSDYFETADNKTKKALVQAIVKKVGVNHDGKIDITFRLPIGNYTTCRSNNNGGVPPADLPHQND